MTVKIMQISSYDNFRYQAKRLSLIIWSFLTTLTVEPIAFINFLSLQLFYLAMQGGMYDVMCVQTFPDSIHSSGHHEGGGHGNGHGSHDARNNDESYRGTGRARGNWTSDHGNWTSDHGNWTSDHRQLTSDHDISINSHGVIDCNNLGKTPDAENLVQQNLSEFHVYLSLAHIFPAIVAHVLLGAWSDKHGRKINILIGITGLIVNSLPYVVLFEYKFMPLWILVITGFLSGCTGYIGIVMISSYAYLADITVDKENLTVRMVIYAIIMSMSGVVGSILAASLISRLSYSYVALINVAMLTLSFFYTLIRIKQVPPDVMKKLMREKQQAQTKKHLPNDLENPVKPVDDLQPLKISLEKERTSDENPSEKKLTKIQTLKLAIIDSLLLLKAVWLTYSKPRPNRRRVYLLCTVGVFLLQLISGMAMYVNSLYLFRSPISWKPADLGYWKAASSTLHFVGNLFGVLILKKLLKCRETSVILIAITSTILQEVVTGIAQAGWMLYLAVTVGCIGQLYIPTVKSFVTQLVDADEVGKAFVMFGLAHDIGGAVSSVLSNAIYRYTVSFFPGFLYLLCSGFLTCALLVVLYIHIDSKRQNILAIKEDKEKESCKGQQLSGKT